MKKLLVAALPLGLAVASSTADARVYNNTGHLCVSDNSSSCIYYSQSGVYNNCTTAKSVECSIPNSYVADTDVDVLEAMALDRHASQDVSCLLRKTSNSGSLIYSAEDHTAGADTAAQFLSWGPIGLSQAGFWTMRCKLPASTALGTSGLITYILWTTE